MVLLQSSKGSGLASAFGIGMGATQVLGVRRTADILSRTTTYLAVIFYVAVCRGGIYDTLRQRRDTAGKYHSEECAKDSANVALAAIDWVFTKKTRPLLRSQVTLASKCSV